MSISAIDQPGRSHIQRDLKHLVRDVRHQVKAEIKELRSGSDEDAEKTAAVRVAYAEFRDEVQGPSRTRAGAAASTPPRCPKACARR